MLKCVTEMDERQEDKLHFGAVCRLLKAMTENRIRNIDNAFENEFVNYCSAASTSSRQLNKKEGDTTYLTFIKIKKISATIHTQFIFSIYQ